MYQPLHIDELLEQPAPPPGRWSFRRIAFNLDRFTKWLNQFVPLRLHYELSKGRKSAETQLAGREEFPEAEWIDAGYSIDEVRKLLELLRWGLDWPNTHFVPDDPLELVLLDGYFDLGGASFFGRVRYTYGIPFSQEDFDRVGNKGGKLRHLVGDILERAACTGRTM